MLVIAVRQSNGLYIPFTDIKNIESKDFSQIVLDIKIVEYKNELVRKTAGIFKNNKTDGLEYERNIRKEWR